MLRRKVVWPFALAIAAALAAALAPLGAPGDPAPLAAAEAPVANDAGSGTDAGGSPGHALVVAASDRPFDGNLNPPGVDVDWFVRGAAAETEAFCLRGTSRPNVPSVLALTWSTDRRAEVLRDVSRGETATLALAAPAGGRPFLGLEPPMMLLSTSEPSAPGHYTFTLDVQRASALDPEGDGESPDGSPSAAAPSPLPARCFAGRLDVAAGDAADHFHVDAVEGDALLVSLASAGGAGDVRAAVLDPAGHVVADVGAGEAASVYARTSGRFVLAVRSDGGTVPFALGGGALASDTEDYLLGVELDPGSGRPCRPTCAGD